MWAMNKAIIIGRDHEHSKKNRQDFLTTFSNSDMCCGIVCDGCGESQYSEVGSTLISTFLLNKLKSLLAGSLREYIFANPFQEDVFKSIIEESIFNFVNDIIDILELKEQEKVQFIQDCFLTTIIFCVIVGDKVMIGNCGDGVVIIGDNARVIDQGGSPHYIAYKNVPQEFLKSKPTKLNFFDIQTINGCDRIVIASDGLTPIIGTDRQKELFGTTGRQLQRKFNVWQTKDKIFYDDTACIVFENNQLKFCQKCGNVIYGKGVENCGYPLCECN